MKLGMKLWGLEYYNVFINHDLDDLDLFYGNVNIGRPCIWMGKIVKMPFERKDLQGTGKWTDDI